MAKFKKKPVIIEASQWFKNGDHPEDYATDRVGFEDGQSVVVPAAQAKRLGWEGDVIRYFRRPDVPGEQVCRHCGQTMHVHGWIDTAQGGHTVCPGDWIINEPTLPGQFYPCKPDAFAATYEACDGD